MLTLTVSLPKENVSQLHVETKRQPYVLEAKIQDMDIKQIVDTTLKISEHGLNTPVFKEITAKHIESSQEQSCNLEENNQYIKLESTVNKEPKKEQIVNKETELEEFPLHTNKKKEPKQKSLDKNAAHENENFQSEKRPEIEKVQSMDEHHRQITRLFQKKHQVLQLQARNHHKPETPQCPLEICRRNYRQVN